MARPMSSVSRMLNGLLAIRATMLLILAPTVMAASLECPTGFANFGDDFTDTGNAASLFPYSTDAELLPYGKTFFGKPSKRFSNGRLVPDFFSLAFGKPLLDPYFKATSYEYQFGINFAEAGANAATGDPPPTVGFPYPQFPSNPVYLYPFQLNQFKRFFNSIVTTESEPACTNFHASLPLPVGVSWVSQWLYTITAGRNDLLNVLRGTAPDIRRAPLLIYENIGGAARGAVGQTVRELYGVGARKFMVFGFPAVGCSPELLTLYPNNISNPISNNPDLNLSRDELGCFSELNNFAKVLNRGFLQEMQILRTILPDAKITFFDYYTANMQILTTPAAFGFTQTLAACCGAQGTSKLNYNPAITCGRPGSNVCSNPDQYVSWDGVRFTDAFYKIISIFALKGKFTDGGINYEGICNLDLSKFSSTFTFNQVYPSVCQTIFV